MEKDNKCPNNDLQDNLMYNGIVEKQRLLRTDGSSFNLEKAIEESTSHSSVKTSGELPIRYMH